MTDEEIAQKYGLDCNKVSYIIEKNGIEMIRMYLANFRKAKITSESLKFYSKFNEYDREQVDQAIDKLSDNYQVVIKEYFGLDGEKLSSKEIMAKHKISHLSSYINRIILTISKMLDMSYIKEYQEKFYEKFKNYSKKEVYAALTKIDYPANEIIKLYYGLDGYRLKPSQIIEKFDISEALMRNYIYNAIKLVTNKLDVTIASSATQNKNNHQEKFYKIFGSHSKVEIDKILFSLDDELKKILISHDGLNGCDKCTTEVLSQQFGYSRGQLNFILKKGINSIKRQLLISKINDTSSENLINVMNKMFFDDINISDINQLKEAMAALDKKELNLIMIYYGLDSKHFMNLSNLSKAFKTTEEKIIAKVENIIFKLNNYNKENKKQI